jgi:hypothetical protein
LLKNICFNKLFVKGENKGGRLISPKRSLHYLSLNHIICYQRRITMNVSILILWALTGSLFIRPLPDPAPFRGKKPDDGGEPPKPPKPPDPKLSARILMMINAVGGIAGGWAFSQVWFSGKLASGVDVAATALGAFLGAAIVNSVYQMLTNRASV